MRHPEHIRHEKRAPISDEPLRQLIENWLESLGTTTLPTLEATAVPCTLGLEQCLLRQLEDLNIDCPDHPVEYNDVEDTQQQVEFTVDPTLLKLDPPHERPVKLFGRELQPDYEGESEDGNNEGEDDGVDDDDRSSEDVDVSPPMTRWWTRDRRALQYLQEADGDSSGGFGSDDDGRSTQAAESSGSSALSDGDAFEVLTVYSDVGDPWREVESLSSGTAGGAEPGGRVGRAEPGDEREGARTLAVPSPEESFGSDVEERGGSDEECTPTTGNPKSDESGGEELLNACPAWMFVPRGLFNGGVKPTAGRCAAYCDPHQLEMSVVAQQKDILRDLGLAVVGSTFGVGEGVGTNSSRKAQPSQLSL